MSVAYWIITIIVLLLIEFLTVSLTTVWFAGGALAAMIIAICGGSPPLQFGVFVGLSFVLLAFTRPIAQKYLNSKTEKTNVESVIGKAAVVVEEINNKLATGQVQIDGVIWSARSASGDVIQTNETVVVKQVKGVKLIVAKTL